MDTPERTEHEITQHALEEHQAVREKRQEILDFLEERTFDSDEEWAVACMDVFRPFFEHLRQHFNLEETGGFMKPVLEVRPTLHPQIEKLKQEHVEMLEAGNLVLKCLDGQPNVDWTLEDVCSRILNLLDVLEEHEEAENRLLVTAFHTDLGSGD